MAGGKEEYNAFFYSLVSTDTQVSSVYETVAIFYSSLVHLRFLYFCDVGDVLFNKKAAVFNRSRL